MNLVQQAIVDELRRQEYPHMSALRHALGLTAAEATCAVQALRYAGKLRWDRLELSSSMLDPELNAGTNHPPDASPSSIAGEEPAPETAVAPIVEEGGVAAAKQTSPPSNPTGPDGGFVPKRLLHSAGINAANTRAARTPLPAPAHEPEIERLVREEVNEGMARRARARSTGTVRQPLEVRKFGIPDLSLSETIGSLLSEEPRDILVAVSRRHPAMWRRCVLLARERGERPIQCLYAALERGLDQLDPQTEGKAQAYGGR